MITATLPVTPNQHAHLLRPLDAAGRGVAPHPFTMTLQVELHGSVDLDALHRALACLTYRHEALRARFKVSNDGAASQHLVERTVVPIEHVDLRRRSDAYQQHATYALTTQQTLTAFDRAHGPLLRVSLLQTARDRAVLVIGIDHIIGDGWSTDLLLEELTQLYAAELGESSSALPPVEMTYSQHVKRVTEMVAGRRGASRDYWLERLRTVGPLPGFHVLGERERRPIQVDAAVTRRTLAPHVASGLRGPARVTTPFVLLASAVHRALARAAGTRLTAFRTPVHNRHDPCTHRLFAPLANTVVHVAADALSLSPEELRRQVAISTADAIDHGEWPFFELIREKTPERFGRAFDSVHLYVQDLTDQDTGVWRCGEVVLRTAEVQDAVTAESGVLLWQQLDGSDACLGLSTEGNWPGEQKAVRFLDSVARELDHVANGDTSQ